MECACGRLQKLEVLYLRNCPCISDGAVVALATHCQRLQARLPPLTYRTPAHTEGTKPNA
jgi:hypothetical protein